MNITEFYEDMVNICVIEVTEKDGTITEYRKVGGAWQRCYGCDWGGVTSQEELQLEVNYNTQKNSELV
jgi:hypothetical protein